MHKSILVSQVPALPPGAVALYLPVEEGRNLIRYSQQFDNAAWLKTEATVTPNVRVAPDQTTTVDALAESDATATHQVSQNVTVAAATTYTYSIHAEAAGRTWIYLKFWSSSSSNKSLYVNLATGQIGGCTAGCTARAIPLIGGGYRVSLTFTTSDAGTGIVYAIIASGDLGHTFDGDPATYPVGLYIWGAQLEQGSVVTTYYPTTDKQILRDYSRPARNLLLPTIANGTSDGATSAFAMWGTGVTLSSSTEQFWQGSRSLKVVCDGTVAGQGQYYQWYTYGLSPGKTYTGSVYVKGTAGATLALHLVERTDAGTGTGGGATVNFTATGGWDRVVATFTAGATGRCANMRVIVNGTLATTFYCDGLQLEEGSVATDWQAPPNHGILGSSTGADTNDPAWGVPGLTFANDDWVATALKGLFAGPGTPFSVVIVTKDAVSGTILARAGTTSSSRTFQLGVHAPGSGERYYVTLRGTQTTLVSGVGGTKAITVTWDGTTATGYDGTTAIPVAVGTAAEETTETVLIGARTAAVPEIRLVGSIAALAIYPYALSDAQVAQAYAYLKNYLSKFGVVLP